MEKEKVVFELTINKSGEPIITFRHYDKSSTTENKLLKLFIDKAKEKGMVISSPSGYANTSGGSWEDYIIKTNK